MLTPVKRTPIRTRPSLFPIGQMLPFTLVTTLFFLWGVPNNLNDVLIRQFMTSFSITRFQAGLVQSAFYLGYFLLAMPAAMLMRRAGYKTGIVTGLILFGMGTFLFWPAAIADRYGFFLMALFVIASGLAFLETASNPFIAELGDPESSERRLNFSQAFNPIGSISGVFIGTTFIFSGVELSPAQISALQASHEYAAYLRGETLRVVKPYLVLGAAAFILAAIIARVRFPETRSSSATAGKGSGGSRPSHLLRRPFFMFSVAAQFLYVGAQVGTWSYFIQYVQDYTHQTARVAGYFLTGSLVAFAVGRFGSSWLMRFVRPGRLMGFYSLANVILVSIGVTKPGWIGMWAIFLTSFFMSLMFPTIFAMGLRGLGEDTKLGGSLLVMAIVGGAILTPAMGLISEASMSLAVAYLVPLGCYVFIMFYSFVGARVSQNQDFPV
ncbi:MAG TPA: L-fucose:H+ symporter permease [Silvibacterium sp.]|nr:L-fucose:H+ symporter permease [Silvibacterium sp.]